MKHALFYSLLFLLVACSGNLNSVQVDEKLSNAGWGRECELNSFDFSFPDYLYVELSRLGSNNIRCEFSNRELISLDEGFRIEFSFIPLELNSRDEHWHSIFQIHSFPDLDLGELWRCPISALEIKGGFLRMYNRWDVLEVSDLKNGTCAHSDNSINSRTLFKDLRVENDKVYKVVIEGVLSYMDHGFLKVYLNNKLLSEVHGPNAFNDEEGPYIKFGVYKPTAWGFDSHIKYFYKNFVFERL